MEQKQGERKEIKIYLQMAAFYKYVMFKDNEYYAQIQKSRQVLMVRKIANEKNEDFSNEKGLILA